VEGFSLKYRLMDILACPMCKKAPLKLLTLKVEDREPPPTVPSKCRFYCAWKKGDVDEVKPSDEDCRECFSKEIVEGVLLCDGCGRWYPIIDEIPYMMPDEIRLSYLDVKEQELMFMRRWLDLLPKEVVEEGKPFNAESLKELKE